MNPQQAYNLWASQYDTNHNKTRDVEAHALRTSLKDISFDNVLEIGCGTGKNTEWFVEKAVSITSVDLSEEMLLRAKEKITSPKVHFKQADITRPWVFAEKEYDLVSFSLVLEHIEDLDHIFKQLTETLAPNGYVYIGELHPFKQYTGSKARFDTAEGLQIVQCFNHNISDFIQSARQYGLSVMDVNEYFDGNDRTTIPRILTIILKRSL